MHLTPLRLFGILITAIAALGWQRWSYPAMIWAEFSQSSQLELAQGARFRLPDDQTFASRLAGAALDRTRHVVRYDASYKKITFPNGDVPSNTGSCVDEVIRAYRAVGVDLQELVYQDMVRCFGAYPRQKNKIEPDTNIDHRLVQNLEVFFKRRGVSLSISHRAEDYEPGDIITCKTASGQPHIAMVVPAPISGQPWIVHNVGWGPRLEDRLFDFRITGHFRYHPRA